MCIFVAVIHSCGTFSSHLDVILFLDTSSIIYNGIKTLLSFKVHFLYTHCAGKCNTSFIKVQILHFHSL